MLECVLGCALSHRAAGLPYTVRRPPSRLTATIRTAITSNRWIRAPAIWKPQPSNQSTRRIVKIVHTTSAPPWRYGQVREQLGEVGRARKRAEGSSSPQVGPRAGTEKLLGRLRRASSRSPAGSGYCWQAGTPRSAFPRRRPASPGSASPTGRRAGFRSRRRGSHCAVATRRRAPQ